jgi:HPr kinase/phosphorylase
MYRVEELYKNQKELLGLQLIAGKEGLKRRIKVPEAERPGLALTGYLKGHVSKRLLIFGKAEIEYLKDLTSQLRTLRLRSLLNDEIPAVIVSRRFLPPKELLTLCEEQHIPLFRSPLMTMNLLSKLTMLLTDEFSESMTCHGSLVEVFGIGVLIQGESAIGKSEAALGLIERGHRLITDDLVKVKRREGYLEGYGPELSSHHMEVRGIGIINVAHLYGVVCVRDRKSLDIVVRLEVWDDSHFYDRVGLDENTIDILGMKIPYHILPVKPGRDVVLLLETIALNHRLKKMGYHSAKEFNEKLFRVIKEKSRAKSRSISHS